jgi:molybdate transport system substrate-binding protein
MRLPGFLAVVALVFPIVVHCEEIHVLSGGAARGFIEPLAAKYAKHKVVIEFQTMGHVQKTMASGEARRYDMLLVTPEVAEKLKLEAKPLARVGIGVAVHESAPLPDISTPAALKKTLLAAKSVVYINPDTGTSGKYVVDMLKKLDVYDALKGKTTLVDSGYAVAPVGEGKVELGIHQISEILPVKGVKLVGPLPAEFQRYTVYAGAVAPGTAKAAAVRDFLQYLSSPEARAGLAKAGYSAPE